MSEKSIDSILHETRLLKVPKEFQKKARLSSASQYHKMYQESVQDPEKFWGDLAGEFFWHKKFTKVLNYSFGKDLFIIPPAHPQDRILLEKCYGLVPQEISPHVVRAF